MLMPEPFNFVVLVTTSLLYGSSLRRIKALQESAIRTALVFILCLLVVVHIFVWMIAISEILESSLLALVLGPIIAITLMQLGTKLSGEVFRKKSAKLPRAIVHR